MKKRKRKLVRSATWLVEYRQRCCVALDDMRPLSPACVVVVPSYLSVISIIINLNEMRAFEKDANYLGL